MNAIPDGLLLHKTPWSWTSSNVQEGRTKVNVEIVWGFIVENIPETLQYNACKYCRVIMVKRQFSSKVQEGQKKLM